ncbi:Hypothetical protein, putative [Bodo saltans]|uniref:Uncharacterized protein n=1 Tax=Bodo saltans TaxID=75058 RepID=A0A0S4JNF5_BODSA|nr:Hypothetical protein, putative [Bodo saltans]|eukprot:CUG93086.1 Hypothetical protein, putative [Bodo saltans]
MAHIFDEIVNGGYFVGFGGLTPEQEACKQFTADNLPALLHIRQREKYVKEIRVCCCGYGEADEDEPLEDNNFSQFQFYLPYTNDLIFFHDKFDFLIKCVAHGVCKVETGFEERYSEAILQVLTFRDTTVPESPLYVLDLRQELTPRTIGEVPRTYEQNQELIESYVQKRNTYADTLRHELEQLEAEQYEAEKLRGEHKSVMGWSNPNTPRGDGAGVHQAAAPSSTSDAQDDASITRIKSAIELAREEAKQADDRQEEARRQREEKDQALIASYVQNGGDSAPSPPPAGMPMVNMLLHIQQEQIRQEQLSKIQEEEETIKRLVQQEERMRSENGDKGTHNDVTDSSDHIASPNHVDAVEGEEVVAL